MKTYKGKDSEIIIYRMVFYYGHWNECFVKEHDHQHEWLLDEESNCYVMPI